jgi:hypothetical protein
MQEAKGELCNVKILVHHSSPDWKMLAVKNITVNVTRIELENSNSMVKIFT